MALDPSSLGGHVSHININSQVLLTEGPQPPTEKTPCSKHFCISLWVWHMCLTFIDFK